MRDRHGATVRSDAFVQPRVQALSIAIVQYLPRGARRRYHVVLSISSQAADFRLRNTMRMPLRRAHVYMSSCNAHSLTKIERCRCWKNGDVFQKSKDGKFLCG